YSGRIVLGDLGIAHIGAYGAPDAKKAIGKLGYLAPEQAGFEGIDHRGDLWASGVCLYELLTGKRLFEKEGSESDDGMPDARARGPFVFLAGQTATPNIAKIEKRSTKRASPAMKPEERGVL